MKRFLTALFDYSPAVIIGGIIVSVLALGTAYIGAVIAVIFFS